MKFIFAVLMSIFSFSAMAWPYKVSLPKQRIILISNEPVRLFDLESRISIYFQTSSGYECGREQEKEKRASILELGENAFELNFPARVKLL